MTMEVKMSMQMENGYQQQKIQEHYIVSLRSNIALILKFTI